MNMFRTGILIAALTGLFLAVGYLLGGQTGIVIAFVVALGMNVFTYWNADKMVLRMYNARQVDEQSAPEFYGIVQDLARRGGLPMPKVFVVDSDQPNAFATGRSPAHASVAATTGLLRRLTRDEIAGVMGHELAHVKNRDTLTMTITATFAGAISMLANFALFFGGGRGRNGLGIVGTLAMMILAPLAAALVQMAISRTREYEADRIGAGISGAPLSLASALSKIAGGAAQIDNVQAERNPATAHMFIINPLHGNGMDNLFSTHPDTGNRIARLEAMAPQFEANVVRGRSGIPDSGVGKRRKGPWG